MLSASEPKEVANCCSETNNLSGLNGCFDSWFLSVRADLFCFLVCKDWQFSDTNITKSKEISKSQNQCQSFWQPFKGGVWPFISIVALEYTQVKSSPGTCILHSKISEIFPSSYYLHVSLNTAHVEHLQKQYAIPSGCFNIFRCREPMECMNIHCILNSCVVCLLAQTLIFSQFCEVLWKYLKTVKVLSFL